MRKTLRTTPEQIQTGPILPTLLKLSVPAIIAFTFHTSFNFVDRLFVSRLGAVELGALGMAFTVQSVVIMIGSGVGVGASALIARSIGAGNRERANNAAEHALLIALALAILFTLAGPPLIRPLFRLLGASEQMLPHILGYLDIILLGSSFSLFTMIGNGILRGEGNTVTPMQVMLVGTLFNIVLDPLLIFGIGPFPELGVRGAALATITGRGLGCIVLAVSLFGKKNLVVLNMWAFRFRRTIIRGIFAVGGPTIVGRLSNTVGLSLIFVLLRPFGDMAKSAFTLGFTYQQIALQLMLGIAQGTLTMTGQNYGAGKIQRVKSVLRVSVLFCTAAMCVLALVVIPSREALVRVFSDVPEVISIGRTMLLIFALGFPFMAGRVVLVQYFQGLGRGLAPLIINFSNMLVFTIPPAILLSRLIGIEGVWIGFAIGRLLTLALAAGWTTFATRRL